jgi:O-antigen/teichoic acid export membrane protein
MGNFAAALFSNFGVQALRFLTMTLLARRLGTGLFGAYNYLLLLVNYGFMVVEFGLKNLAIREWAQGRGSGQLIRRIFKIRVLLAMGAVLVMAGLTYSAFPHSNYLSASLFIGASLFMDAFLTDFVLIAQEDLVAQAAGNLAQAAFLFVGCYLFVKGEKDFLSLAQFFFLSHLVWAAVLGFCARRALASEPRTPIAPNSLWKTALSGAPFMVATFVAGVFTTMDLLLLGQFHYEDRLGDYSAALKVLGIALGIINSLLASVQPRLAKVSQDVNSADTRALIWSTTRFLWMFVAPTVLGCWLFGDQLVVWVFGAKFAGTGPLLKPLSLAFAFLTLAMGPLHLINVSHYTRALLKIVFFNFAVSVVTIGGILALQRPGLVPWGMAFVNFVFMISVWAWYGQWLIVVLEDAKAFALPSILLAMPLLTNLGPALRFVLAAAAYAGGLALLGAWKQPWFTRVLGRHEPLAPRNNLG